MVVWHAGTPNLGAPPEPLFAAARRLGVRWVGYDRPGYGGSTGARDRDVASAAADVEAVVDSLGVDRFAVLGHSGGGPHALACASLLPDRVAAVVSLSGPAPYAAVGLDWFAGMAPAGVSSLTAARAGRASYDAHLAAGEEEDIGFTAEDWAALEGRWAWLMSVVRPALGAPGAADDDLATAGDWGFDPTTIRVPTLVVHGGRDRVVPPDHGRWLAAHIPGASLRLLPEDGHITVLDAAESALGWLVSQAG